MIKSVSEIISLFLVLIICAGKFVQVISEIHVGTFCTKHEDCVRYCAYSKYGPEGCSCCFPEKIRISKDNWIKTGSNTCYCCPDPLQTSEELRGSKPRPTASSNVLFTPATFGLNRNNKTETCLEYLKTNSGISDDVTSDFCASGKCIQAMVIMKMSFEYPSVCRSRKFPPSKNQS